MTKEQLTKRHLINSIQEGLAALELYADVKLPPSTIIIDNTHRFPVEEAKGAIERKFKNTLLEFSSELAPPHLENLIEKHQNNVKNEPSKEETLMVTFETSGSIRPKRGGFEYRFMLNGKQHSVYAKTKEGCFKRWIEIISDGENKSTTKKPSLTYEEWATHWLKTYKEPHIKPESLKDIKTMLNVHILPVLGSRPIVKLNFDELQVFINGFIEKPNTQKKIYNVLKGSLEKALRAGKIKTNPAYGLELKRYTKKKSRALTIVEQAELYAYLQANSKRYFNLFRFCCCTGIRIGRVLSLTRGDIDITNYEMTVYMKQKQGSEETYKVPFLPELLEGLPANGLLFPDTTRHGAQLYFAKTLKKLEIKDISIHSFRHTFVSCLRFIGVPVEFAKAWAGHKLMAMTMDVYTHPLKNEGNSPIIDYLRRLKAAQNINNV